MMGIARFGAAIAVCTFATAASAQQAYGVADGGVRKHDGFFLQMQYGGAYQDLSQNDADMSLSGGGASLSIAIGGTPAENFVIFGEVSAQLAVDPELEMRGQRYRSSQDVSLGFSTIGPGIAYYFGESKFFLSGMIGAARATLEGPTGSVTAGGFGGRFGLGKEWWVSDQWGLGLAANVYRAAVTDSVDAELSTTAFALSFSATYH